MEAVSSCNHLNTMAEGVENENNTPLDPNEESKAKIKSVFNVEMSSIPKVAQQEVISRFFL